MEKPRYKGIYIYFGCKRDKTKNDKHQPKNINVRWYVTYEYLQTNGTYKKFKAYGGLNRYHTVNERYFAATALRDALEEALENGYNPITNDFESKIDASANPAEIIRQMPIVDGLHWALEKHKPHIAPKTQLDYANVLKHLTTALKELGTDKIPAGSFRKMHLREAMEHLKAQRNLSNKRYNAYVEYTKGLYVEFVKYDVFDVSPIAHFERLKETEARPHEMLTDQERRAVFNHFKGTNPNFLTYFLLIYHTALRPKELVALQISNYHEDEGVIRITPEETITLRGQIHRKTKTNKTRYVPVPPEAMKLLRDMNLKQYPKDYYIFSTGFQPGPVNIDRKKASDLWLKEVKGQLGISKNMYSLKHLGINDKLKAGVSMQAVQKQAGHVTPEMTERYSDDLKRIQGREIKDKSGNFIE